jgi:uncharacterized protein YdeI (YjbR/CyaY-like superfamily)
VDHERVFFATPDDFRSWLVVHHASRNELWVGFRKKATGQPSLTWPESVDQALCFGWIDGVRKGIDAESYEIRFSPRRANGIWSKVNMENYARLQSDGWMTEAGRAAYERRRPDKTGVYSSENRQAAVFSEEQERRFRADPGAWRYFQERPHSYRRAAIWWVINAKQAATRERRLDQLITDSAAGRTIPPLTRSK